LHSLKSKLEILRKMGARASSRQMQLNEEENSNHDPAKLLSIHRQALRSAKKGYLTERNIVKEELAVTKLLDERTINGEQSKVDFRHENRATRTMNTAKQFVAHYQVAQDQEEAAIAEATTRLSLSSTTKVATAPSTSAAQQVKPPHSSTTKSLPRRPRSRFVCFDSKHIF
jgi:hypothetical protein